jgi:hypothetical protein
MTPAKQGSISFLKKRNKKLLMVDAAGRSPRTEKSKNFLVLFFKKELLPWRLPSFTMIPATLKMP